MDENTWVCDAVVYMTLGGEMKNSFWLIMPDQVMNKYIVVYITINDSYLITLIEIVTVTSVRKIIQDNNLIVNNCV